MKLDGKRQRPLDTVKPLAGDLGLEVDTSCDRDDAKCVKKVVDKYDGKGNILICWEHDALKDIAEELGAKDVDDYPDESYVSLSFFLFSLFDYCVYCCVDVLLFDVVDCALTLFGVCFILNAFS